MLIPKLFSTLRGYDRQQFARDAGAGVIVGIVALPLAIAFAIASGVAPERGLWTAIIAGGLISLLGGSRVQIGGPTGAFVVIVYGIVQKHGVDGLTVATLMAGALLIVFGVARLGSAIQFVPHPLITGFTSGIAVIIFSSEVKDFLGLRMGEVPAAFIEKWQAYGNHLPTATPAAIGIALLAISIIVLWPRVTHRIPGPFVALIVTTAVVSIFDVPVETIGSRFGAIASSFPDPRLPEVSLVQLRELIGPAFTIALLGAVESLLSAVVADGMIGGRHRSNMELIGQGVANIVAPIFGGIPATGAIARTATNVKNGGRTPVAGIVHALTLLAITLAAGRWAALIPMPTLAAILVVVAYHMSEWRTFRSELKSPKSDAAVLVTTFLLTILVDLTVAIGVGMALAALLFIRRMAKVTSVRTIVGESEDDEVVEQGPIAAHAVPAGVQIYEINGPFFFGAAQTFKDALARVAQKPKVLILRLRHVSALDSTGLHALKDVIRRSQADGTVVLLSDVQMQPLVALTKSDVLAELGPERLYMDIEDALTVADQLLRQASK